MNSGSGPFPGHESQVRQMPNNGKPSATRINSHDRQRVRRACVECRVKKVKCNGLEPCARCTSYNICCEYGEFAGRNPGANNNVDKLEARVASMEHMFRQFLDQFQNIQQSVNAHTPLIDPQLDSIPQELDHSTSSAAASQPRQLVAVDLNANPNANKIQQLLDAAQAHAAQIDDVELDNGHQELGEDEVNDVPSEDEEQDDDTALASEKTGVEDCYADAFGSLDVDTHGQLRYVGLGSTASLVDNCVGLRRHINKGLEKKGFESEEPFFASPEATHLDGPTNSPVHKIVTGPALPPSELVDVLITTYAKELAFLFPITNESDIRQLYEKLLSQCERDPGYAAVFFALLAVSAPLLTENHPVFEKLDIQWQSNQLGASFYNESMHYVNLPTHGKVERKGRSQDMVTALGLLSMYLAETGSQAEAWISVGRAIRNAQDLGLHRSPESLRLPPEERNKRRYIWWCLYILEKQLCTALGRPLSIDDQDCDTEIPSSEGDELAGFTSMIHLHKIIGTILKIVNSVRNANSWRVAGNHEKIDELRDRVREANEALQVWAKDMVPPQIKTAKSGTLLAEKHVSLSSFFSAVILLHRVFMSNPHRPSPLAESTAQMKSAKAATDCIRGTVEFFQCVPKSHFMVFHGQYVFVSAIVLLQCVRSSDDMRFVFSALKDVELAMEVLRNLEYSWKGASRCRAIVEEYLEFTFHVLQGDRKGQCQFGCDHGQEQHDTDGHIPKKKRAADRTNSERRHKRKRQLQSTQGDAQTETSQTVQSTSRSVEIERLDNCAIHRTAAAGSTGAVQPQTPPADVLQLEDSYFDDTIGTFLGAINPNFEFRDPYFGGLSDVDFIHSDFAFLSPENSVGLQNSFF